MAAKAKKMPRGKMGMPKPTHTGKDAHIVLPKITTGAKRKSVKTSGHINPFGSAGKIQTKGKK